MKKTDPRRLLPWITAALVVLLLGIFAAAMIDHLAPEPSGASTQSTASSASPFPSTLVAGGKLRLLGLTRSNAENPDNAGIYGENIATLVVKNISKEHLQHAEIRVTLENGKTLYFTVWDLPAGKTAMVFDSRGSLYDGKTPYQQIHCDPAFTAGDQKMSEQVDFYIVENEVTVQNITQEPLEGLQVVCHSVINGNIFGGAVYTYTVDSLEPGQSITLDASDCAPGEPLVVGIRPIT